MASSAAATMAHQMPPMSIPPMPRIRPPRMLKGTPSPNTNPQPPGAVPPNRWWVQGKWRNPASNASKQQSQTQARQVAKALRHETHGLDIYAYRHVRTNQVVYSLTRTLQEGKILKQLVFHGKKTVPAQIRPDMWAPYFSIHFPPTPTGALDGLFAFAKLRELSLQRQLSPPDDLIRVTQEDIDVIKSKLGTPVELQELAARDRLEGRVPKLGEILPKKLHARRLMDQKATSVADAAFVLEWITAGPGPLERLTELAANRVVKHNRRTKRARRRINQIREYEGAEEEKIQDRITLALDKKDPTDKSHLPLSPKALAQMSMDLHGVIDGDRLIEVENVNELREAVQQWESFNEVNSKNLNMELWAKRQYVGREAERKAIQEWFELNDAPMTEQGSVWKDVAEARTAAFSEFDEKEGKTLKVDVSDKEKPDWAENTEVKMFWSDLNDGLFASAWPKNVVHGSLAPFGVAKALPPGRPQMFRGRVVGEVSSKSVHVIGSGADDGWMPKNMAKASAKEPEPWTKPPEEDQDGETGQGRRRDGQEARDTTTDAAAMEAARRDAELQSPGLWGRVRGLFGGRKQHVV
ncbi:hypothetical protein LTR99_004657 [Exophiala xenobiotica]|uniref:Large ribosomal subunit protein mL67 n=1 Tax=Vermiconidia calcicola TaxID=1690605 RepID=A0AAV9QG83_9PEZI|nr:hypothetical protein LTR72_004423 [Exophiala xenobiotica]KAK5539938.1 hypothetical protein LTR25_003643 [Vermiconidia calcicola]KAK5546943.1 hypothetical protein LTR23_002946 [Chaetothyriales sp. CCFEE 6169]KAK5274635.1 hypothetical protein LTR96_001236 [Exophiala xenobiotica]KAK5293725.1 hypothetical protein LTR14_004616 [Exophiala xenobiotica]